MRDVFNNLSSGHFRCFSQSVQYYGQYNVQNKLFFLSCPVLCCSLYYIPTRPPCLVLLIFCCSFPCCLGPPFCPSTSSVHPVLSCHCSHPLSWVWHVLTSSTVYTVHVHFFMLHVVNKNVLLLVCGSFLILWSHLEKYCFCTVLLYFCDRFSHFV